MQRNRRIACSSLLLLLGFAASITGCGTRSAAPNQNNGGLKVQSTAPSKIAGANSKQVAAHLEHLARGISGVKGANCVVFGNYAIVGIDVDEKMERAKVGTVKYAVAEAFRKDPYGIDALVTADMDLRQRLREIRADIQGGRPVAGFAEELADIVGRIVPQIPRNIIPPESPENHGTTDLKKLEH
jgi:YhcN/YlaJ family sporulation lipoprotein